MLKFKVRSRRRPPEFKTKYYAVQTTQRRITMREIEKELEQSTTLTRVDIRATISALAEALERNLKEGRIVDLGELGSFMLHARARGVDSEKAVTRATISQPHIVYRPKIEMRHALEDVKYVIERDEE